jgi:dihydroorotase
MNATMNLVSAAVQEVVGGAPQELVITTPDDWHLHVRDGDQLATTVKHSAAQVGRAVVMPNLRPPVTTAAQAMAYRKRILAAVPKGMTFEPLMTLYLTDDLPPEEIKRAKDAGVVGAKLYPANVTTNSAAGVTDIRKVYPTFEAMQRHGMVLEMHCEVARPEIDFYSREAVAIDEMLIPIRTEFPALKIVVEHISTKEMVQYLYDRDANLLTAATITGHHLFLNRNSYLGSGFDAHAWCAPAIKDEPHRRALVTAATSGDPRFFLGSDSAPHAAHLKARSLSCTGCYTADTLIETCTEVFEGADALTALEGFASFHGADFYGLPRNLGTITLRKESWKVPDSYPFGDAELVPLRAGQVLPWKVVG